MKALRKTSEGFKAVAIHSNQGLRKVCGCPRKGWPKCKHSWFLNYKNPLRLNPKTKYGDYRLSLDRQLGKHIELKGDAEIEAAKIRVAIDEGRFGHVAPRQEMTLQQLADDYLEREVEQHHKATRKAYEYSLNPILRTIVRSPTGGDLAFGRWRAADIVKDSVERFREARLKAGVGRVGVNRSMRTLRALFNWGIGAGHLNDTPFKRSGVVVVKMERESKRTRRLKDGESEALLAVCGSYLRAIVTAALETGMRKGEILSLQWHQVEGMRIAEDKTISWAPKSELFLPKTKTKTKRDRRIPISTTLKAVLDMRRLDPKGEPHPIDAFVFGSEIGTRVTTFKRAWLTAVLKAHGGTPIYRKGANLAPESRVALKSIDLHFHDLRREAGSRWMDGGVVIATVQQWLGHENVSQTSTYLARSAEAEHAAMARYEAYQAALQQVATKGESGGTARPGSAAAAEQTPNKDRVGRATPIM